MLHAALWANIACNKYHIAAAMAALTHTSAKTFTRSNNKCASFQTAFHVFVVAVADVAAAPTNIAGCAYVAAIAVAVAAVHVAAGVAAGVAAAAAAAARVERKKNTKPKNVARLASV